MSESPRHSDKDRSKRFEAVRIPVSFGQEPFQKNRSCSNPPSIRTRKAQKFRGLSESLSVIRTRKAQKSRGVSESLIIRTRTVSKEPELSETTLYSDKESPKVQRIVRISPSFGQGPFQKNSELSESHPHPDKPSLQTIYTDPTYQKIG
ncbi:hypothetical protein [Neobacillus cucumis]|uniref:hypothetical protein n=1 Tax=Neobacillus cucumis TaxID=1740721 RepID=UPI002E1E1EA3|nr:hypothetical protein [Neobacillus cucumis]